MRLGIAKIAVLAGSLLAGIFGIAIGLFVCRRPTGADLAMSVDEAERSTER
jgi:hypothetical protein